MNLEEAIKELLRLLRISKTEAMNILFVCEEIQGEITIDATALLGTKVIVRWAEQDMFEITP